MTLEEHIKKYYNEVNNLTAVCRTNSSWSRGEQRELRIGETYHVSHIGVLRSTTNIMLSEFGEKEYNAGCFDLYENGECLEHKYSKDLRFWAPYLRKLYRDRDSLTFANEMERTAIPAHLKCIEQEYDVKILLAVESGSRAWGFESKNSDWDVRFIYVHKPEWYLRVEEQRDVIEHMYEDDVDLSGWELRKALLLFRRSNPSLFEWLHSPKVYHIDDDFEKRIHAVEQDFFNPVKTMYHYNHIYNKQNERFLQKEGYPMKKFLYFLRGILACKWIEEHNSLPPVAFEKLLDATIANKDIRAKVDELIQIKKGEKELDIMIVDTSLVEYARNMADYYNKFIGEFRPEQNNVPADSLDSILFDMVMSHK